MGARADDFEEAGDPSEEEDPSEAADPSLGASPPAAASATAAAAASRPRRALLDLVASYPSDFALLAGLLVTLVVFAYGAVANARFFARAQAALAPALRAEFGAGLGAWARTSDTAAEAWATGRPGAPAVLLRLTARPRQNVLAAAAALGVGGGGPGGLPAGLLPPGAGALLALPGAPGAPGGAGAPGEGEDALTLEFLLDAAAPDAAAFVLSAVPAAGADAALKALRGAREDVREFAAPAPFPALRLPSGDVDARAPVSALAEHRDCVAAVFGGAAGGALARGDAGAPLLALHVTDCPCGPGPFRVAERAAAGGARVLSVTVGLAAGGELQGVGDAVRAACALADELTRSRLSSSAAAVVRENRARRVRALEAKDAAARVAAARAAREAEEEEAEKRRVARMTPAEVLKHEKRKKEREREEAMRMARKTASKRVHATL